MTIPFSAGFRRSALFVLILLAVTVVSSRAGDVPKSVDVIQSVFPDSISLQSKVVYVDFWASWCMPCRHSFPWMEKLYREYHAKGLEIIAISVDKNHEDALKFLEQNKAPFTILFDSTGTLAKQFNLETMPTSFLYGTDGNLITYHRGFREDDTDSLEIAIHHLIKARSTK